MRYLLFLAACSTEVETCDPCSIAQVPSECVRAWDDVLDARTGCYTREETPSYRLGQALGCADLDGPATAP